MSEGRGEVQDTSHRREAENTGLAIITAKDQPSSCGCGGGGHKVRAVHRSQGGPSVR